jgi:hypothetical protein
MIEKFNCKIDKEDYLEIEQYDKYVVFEIVNFFDGEKPECALASLSKEQVKELITKLNVMIEKI